MKTFDDPSVQQKFRAARIACGLTAAQVYDEMKAAGSPITPSGLARYESGARAPGPQMIHAWGSALLRLGLRRAILTKCAVDQLADMGFIAAPQSTTYPYPTQRRRHV